MKPPWYALRVVAIAGTCFATGWLVQYMLGAGPPSSLLAIATMGALMLSALLLERRLSAEAIMQSDHEALESEVEQRTADLRAANLALERRGTLMRQAEELASMGSFEFEIATRALKWSDELYRIYGRDPTTFVPTFERFVAAIHPSDRDAVVAGVTRALETASSVDVVERIMRPDGSVRVLQTLARVTLDERGTPVRLIGCCRDITSRVAEERARSRLVRVVESSDDAIIGLTSDGVVETWNPAATRMFGFEANEAIGRPFKMLVPRDSEPRLLEMFDAIREGEHDSHSELVHQRKDGSRFPASSTTSAVLDANGAVVGMAKVIRDITVQKQVETRLRSSLQEKDVLLREIHHRVKNNLQVIASLLNIQLTGEANPATATGLVESQNRIQSMALVHQLLYQSKDLAQLDFGEYLSKLAGRLAETYSERDNRISIEVKAQPLRLDVDHAIPCGLIVNELVTNALTHAFPDGRSGTIRITVERKNLDITLVVQDDGVGVPTNVGSGERHSFGLRIARALTQQLGGSLAITREDVGSRVVLKFPCRWIGTPRPLAPQPAEEHGSSSLPT